MDPARRLPVQRGLATLDDVRPRPPRGCCSSGDRTQGRPGATARGSPVHPGRSRKHDVGHRAHRAVRHRRRPSRRRGRQRDARAPASTRTAHTMPRALVCPGASGGVVKPATEGAVLLDVEAQRYVLGLDRRELRSTLTATSWRASMNQSKGSGARTDSASGYEPAGGCLPDPTRRAPAGDRKSARAGASNTRESRA